MTHSSTRRLLVCLTLLSALSLESQGALADASTAAAHAQRAQVAFDLQNWDTAASEFEAAYKAEQKPEYLWSLAQAQRLAGKYADAIRTYKAFQRLDVSANQANTAEMMVTKCEAEISKAEAKAAQEASRPREEKPVAPAPAQPPPSQPVEESSGGLGVGWFITGVGLTLALGATSTWSALDVSSKNSTYEGQPTRAGYLEGQDAEMRTNILFGATAVVGVATGVIAVFTDWSGSPASDERQGWRVQPAVGTTGGSLLLTGAF